MHYENNFQVPQSTPTPPEHTSLRYLRETLAWTDRQISEGVREVDEKMNALSREIKNNNELLRKKKEIVEAIAILERNL